MDKKPMREPIGPDKFYPADPQALSQAVEQFLTKAAPPVADGQVFGLIVPHAGYQFSGYVAVQGFRTLLGKSFDTVVLIGNSHYEAFDGIAVFSKGVFNTPLGRVEVDSDLAGALVDEHPAIIAKEAVHSQEHSLEVELPFLQKTLADFKIVPILFGNSSRDDYKILAQVLLNNIKGKNVLLVASSDLSHYPSYIDAKNADSKTISAILTGDTNKLEAAIRELAEENIPNAATFACGIDAIKTLMAVSAGVGASEIKLLGYANSGDLPDGDKDRVVGYAAIGFFGRRETVSFPELNKDEQRALLQVAKTSLETFIKEGKVPQFQVEDPVLGLKLGAFVTLKKPIRQAQGQLRGCIGRFSPTDIPLWQVVSQMAIAAGTQDARFAPAQKEELSEIKYEISVLSPLKQVAGWQEIKLGQDGVLVRQGEKSGVFLPQVAAENNWDLEKFMSELCSQKAGLPADCWKQKETELYIFAVQSFGE